jgi:hypothetical protein
VDPENGINTLRWTVGNYIPLESWGSQNPFTIMQVFWDFTPCGPAYFEDRDIALQPKRRNPICSPHTCLWRQQSQGQKCSQDDLLLLPWFKIFTEELGNIKVFCDITLFRVPDNEDGRNSFFQNVGILTKWNLRLAQQSSERFKTSGILGCFGCSTMNMNYTPMKRQYIDHAKFVIHTEK